MRHRSIKSRGSAITEAVIVMPVLLTILYGLYYVWRVSIVASHATIVARSEMMQHSLAINGESELNSENWAYVRDHRAGWSPDAQFYSGMGMFPGVPADSITMTIGRQKSDWDDSLGNVYDSMRRAMTGRAAVQVSVPLPHLPFLHGGAESPEYKAEAICSVNPWALSQEQFFGATQQWLGEMAEHPEHSKETNRTLLDSVTPIDALPEH